jgi:hypothetical protein
MTSSRWVWRGGDDPVETLDMAAIGAKVVKPDEHARGGRQEEVG